MPKIQLDLTEQEAKKLEIYAAEFRLSGKIEAVKKLIAELNIEVKMK